MTVSVAGCYTKINDCAIDDVDDDDDDYVICPANGHHGSAFNEMHR